MSVDISAVARVVGIDTQFKDLRAGSVQFLPQHIAILGHGSTPSAGYALTPYRITSALQAAQRYGFGSPIHQAARELFPPTGGGVGSIPVTVLPLAEDAAGTAAVGSITPSGAATVTATYWVRVAGVASAPITVVAGDSVATIADKIVAAIDAVLEMPVDAADGATDVDLAVKWKGASGNDITVEVLDVTGEAPTTGLTFAIVQPATGATDPDVAPGLALLGSTWITMIVNTLGPSNTAALEKISVAGEARWGELLRRPFVCFTGNPEPVVGTATTATAARSTYRASGRLVARG
jgi:phage tail sheath gpL-like